MNKNDKDNLARVSPPAPSQSQQFQQNRYQASDVLEILKEAEGFYDSPYRDSYGKWTVGYGTLIGDGGDKDFAASPYAGGRSVSQISSFTKKYTPYTAGRSISQLHNTKDIDESKEVALGMAEGEAKEKLRRVRGEGEWAKYPNLGADTFDALPKKLQNLILSSAYRGGITGSPKTIEMIKDGDFIGASAEFLNNAEYRKARQPGSDARGVAIRMEKLSNALREHGQDMKRNWGDDTIRRILGKLPQ
tara:strand:+ start:1564 stop:2304 length:741 start_codon:yes stop_codon:yes gene_type:complete